MNLKNSGDSTGFEPMTSAMPVQCSSQLSYEVTLLSFCNSQKLEFYVFKDSYTSSTYLDVTRKIQDNNTRMQMCTLIRTELVDSITEFASETAMQGRANC